MVKSQQKPLISEIDGHHPTRRWIAAMRADGWPEERIENVVETASEPEVLLTLGEASSEFDISLGTLQTWVHRGLLVPRGRQKFHAPGGRRHLVDRDDVVYLIEHPPPNGRPRKFPDKVKQ